MNFNLKIIPFSRYGSYMVFSYLPPAATRQEGLYLRTVRGPALSTRPRQETFRIQLTQAGQPVPFQIVTSPTLLRLENDNGFGVICIPEPNVVRIKCVGTGLRLSMDTAAYDYAIPGPDNTWQIVTCAHSETKYMMTPLQGNLTVDAPWQRLKSQHITLDLTPDSETGIGELALEEFTTSWNQRTYTTDFDTAQQTVKEGYAAWQLSMPEVPVAYASAIEMAAYINWSCVVAPSGYLTRPAMFMSKGAMASIWSWDNCFNAMALAYQAPDLAWDQLMTMIDHQDASGVFPDLINDRLVSWSFCKPPVLGWVLKRLMKHTNLIDKTRMQEIYEPLCRWTEWWFMYRDDDEDGIPQYNHGNDSGWDNSTIFASRPPIESPDLAAYLVIQMDVLAKIAQALDKPEAAAQWRTRANVLLQKMIDHFWQGDRFVAMQSGAHEAIASESLLLYVPIILGQRLPPNIQAKLVEGLRENGRFLTPYGLATESINSPLYESDGYWRGPIWAAPILMIVDGLMNIGETDFARDLSQRFCEMVVQNGVAENYDAISGTALRERGFTWTASIFIVLAHEMTGGGQHDDTF